jgi:hypothetical protein
MPLPPYLTKPLRWLRAGYPPEAPPHGHVALIALMPSRAAQPEDLLDADALPGSRQLPGPAGDHHRRRVNEKRVRPE